jgi:hypothetical protein
MMELLNLLNRKTILYEIFLSFLNISQIKNTMAIPMSTTITAVKIYAIVFLMKVIFTNNQAFLLVVVMHEQD